MASKTEGKSPARKPAPASPGGLGKWLRRLVFFLGFVTVLSYVGNLATASAIKGSWQFRAPELSDESMETVLRNAEEKTGQRKPGEPSRISDNMRKTLKNFSSALMGAVAKKVTLDLVDGGYRVDAGVLTSRLASSALQGRNSTLEELQGCLSGTWSGVFPLVRIHCGDGSGRSYWLLMRGWPGKELRLLPLPIGTSNHMRERLEKLVGDLRDPARRDAALELATLTFDKKATTP